MTAAATTAAAKSATYHTYLACALSASGELSCAAGLLEILHFTGPLELDCSGLLRRIQQPNNGNNRNNNHLFNFIELHVVIIVHCRQDGGPVSG